jgi:hypothetical protein
VLDDDSVAFLGAEAVRDDDLFDAALVSFGSFGIIHGVVLEVDDLFWLQQYRRQHAESPATWAALEHLDFSGLQRLGRPASVRPYFFQAVYNPYDRADGPYLTVMYREDEEPEGCRPPGRATAWRPGDSAADVIARFTDLSPSLTPTLVNALLPSQYPDLDGRCGTWGETFWDTSRRGRVASTAMGIPLDRAREAVETLFDVNEDHTAPALFALRYVQASAATLAFTRHAPHTAVLEIDGPYSRGMFAFYEAAWEAVRDLGFPVTFHWGKMLPLADDLPTRGWGADRVQAWRDARHTLLPSPELRAAFANDMLRRLGLDD